ncbi:hypothetical protein RCZ04_22480 [Capnocytophaga sp. HP1101]
MKRVILLLSAVGLFTACDKNNDWTPSDPIYFADKIVETTLPQAGTQTQTTEYLFEYQQNALGLVRKSTKKVTDGNSRIQEEVYETSYDGTFPTKTVYTLGGVKKWETVYNSYSRDRGRLLRKTTTEVGKENLPTVDEYEYNGGRLKKHTKAEKLSANETRYTVVEYDQEALNEIKTVTSVYTETSGVKSTATTTATDTYVLNYNETVREHSHTVGGKTTITTYGYDGRTNPWYLHLSYRATHPEVFLDEQYARNNITRKTVKDSNATGRSYEEEIAYSYFKTEYPLKATVKENGREVKTIEFTY